MNRYYMPKDKIGVLGPMRDERSVKDMMLQMQFGCSRSQEPYVSPSGMIEPRSTMDIMMQQRFGCSSRGQSEGYCGYARINDNPYNLASYGIKYVGVNNIQQ